MTKSEKMRIIRTGKKHSEQTIEKIRMTSLKRVFTPEILEKMARASVKATGKKVVCIENGREYESESDAARKVGVSVMSISRACHGKQFTVKKLTYKFLNEYIGDNK